MAEKTSTVRRMGDLCESECRTPARGNGHFWTPHQGCPASLLYPHETPWLDGRVLGVPPVLLVVTFFAASAVDVRSTTNCPSTAEVMEHLQPLLPRGSAVPQRDHMATLDVVEARPDGTMGMHLRLLRDDGSAIGDRQLLFRGSCQEMAEAIAGVIAAWETEPLSEPPARVAQVSRDEGVAMSAPATVPRHATTQVQGGVGVGAGFVGGLAAVGNAELQIGRADSRWQLRLGMMSERARRLDLDAGLVEWRHTMAEAGLLVRSLGSAWVWSLDAGPTLGWATHQGLGYAANRQERSLEYGVVAGVRIGRRFGRWTVWAEGRADLWLRGQGVVLSGSEATADLPRGDVRGSVGTTVLLFE